MLSRIDVNAPMPTWAIGLLALIIGSWMGYVLWTGKISGRSGAHTRGDSPQGYWSGIGIIGLLLIVVLWELVHRWFS